MLPHAVVGIAYEHGCITIRGAYRNLRRVAPTARCASSIYVQYFMVEVTSIVFAVVYRTRHDIMIYYSILRTFYNNIYNTSTYGHAVGLC